MDTDNSKVESNDDIYESFATEAEFVDDDLRDNINSTPLGRLLSIIGSLPEIRKEKVVHVRRQIHHGRYDDLGNNLDAALDRVLEELISEG